MRSLIRSVAFGVMVLSAATTASAADGAGQDGNSSPVVWIIIFLPAFLIFVFLFFVIRKNRALTERSMKRFEEHRSFSEAHMKRLESQIENLDKRMLRMIELLEAIAKAERREPS